MSNDSYIREEDKGFCRIQSGKGREFERLGYASEFIRLISRAGDQEL
jgi:hypothetical protein